MKIYLASYSQPENHGPGRKIAIANTKPDDIEVVGAWSFAIPDVDLMSEYRSAQLQDQTVARKIFVEGYKRQLDNVFDSIRIDAERDGKTPVEMLPFKDGDTLLSWEREGFTTYRGILANYLEDIGVNIILK